jgi:hypothetical protein
VPNHPDYKHLQDALESISQVAMVINQSVHEMDNRLRMVAIQVRSATPCDVISVVLLLFRCCKGMWYNVM